jgi:DNA-directed RNA polymerase specialized sigma24 family protein
MKRRNSSRAIMLEKEKTLIAGCLRSEKAAWDSFVRQYSNLVYHTIKKTLIRHHRDPHADVVEELYQEFFVSLLRNGCKKLLQFRGTHGCSLASWLRIVTTRLTIDFIRKQALPSGELPSASARSLLPSSVGDRRNSCVPQYIRQRDLRSEEPRLRKDP